MRVTFPKVDASVPTSVLRSRYHRHTVRSAVAWQGELEQMASGESGSAGRATRLAAAAVESRDYAALIRDELHRRRVIV